MEQAQIATFGHATITIYNASHINIDIQSIDSSINVLYG